MITDLTKEHPNKTLWRFLLPMLFSVMFQQIYNIADSMIAGRFAGENALAAVGASYPITIIFMAFAVGNESGCLRSRIKTVRSRRPGRCEACGLQQHFLVYGAGNHADIIRVFL